MASLKTSLTATSRSPGSSMNRCTSAISVLYAAS